MDLNPKVRISANSKPKAYINVFFYPVPANKMRPSAQLFVVIDRPGSNYK